MKTDKYMSQTNKPKKRVEDYWLKKVEEVEEPEKRGFHAGQVEMLNNVTELIKKELKVRKLGGDVATRMILEKVFSTIR